MTKPYAENKTGLYLENTFLDRKTEKIGFGFTANTTPLYFFPFKVNELGAK